METKESLQELKENLNTMGFEKPSCRNCKFRQEVGWSSHSRCSAVDKLNLSEKEQETISITGKIKVKEVKFHQHGVNNGWANWPTDFDPCWLEECSLFEDKRT
jgi:hypothetical protein